MCTTEQKREEEICEGTIAKNFSKLMTVTKPQTKEAQKTLRTIILKLLHVSTHAQTAESQRRKNLPKRARMVRTAGDFSSEDTQRDHSGLLPSELPFEHENASRCEWTRPARNTDGASGTRQRQGRRRGGAAVQIRGGDGMARRATPLCGARGRTARAPRHRRRLGRRAAVSDGARGLLARVQCQL